MSPFATTVCGHDVRVYRGQWGRWWRFACHHLFSGTPHSVWIPLTMDPGANWMYLTPPADASRRQHGANTLAADGVAASRSGLFV